MDDTGALLDAIKAGQPQALEQFRAAYTPLLRYIIAPILPDLRDREECLADVLVQVWRKVGQYDPARGSLTGWLTALARNAALNRLRAGRRHQGGVELDESIPDSRPGPEESLLREERALALRRAVAALSAGDRALFLRKYYYYQATPQIAAELGLSERAVEGRLYRIRKRLRRELGGDMYD